MNRKTAAAILVGAIAALGVPAGQADPIKECIESDEPRAGWTTEGTQKGSCKSSHDREDEAVNNPGGRQPPGQQP